MYVHRVHLRKSNEAPIKVEDDPDIIEAREQSSRETREDTGEQAPRDTRVEHSTRRAIRLLRRRTQLNRPEQCKYHTHP